MQIKIDKKLVCELTDTQCKVICNDIDADIFDEDMARRVHYIVTHKYEQCLKRLKAEWDPKLKQAGVAMVPTDPDAYAELVFSQPGYKDRAARMAEEKI